MLLWKPSTIFYPYEVYSKEDYDVRVLEWITDNFNPNDTSCNLNEMYVIAFKGYADKKAENRALMPVINYESVFDVKNNPERFIIGRFYRAGFPTLKWVLSPTLSPFGVCAPQGHGFTYSATEHGVILGLVMVRADVSVAVFPYLHSVIVILF